MVAVYLFRVMAAYRVNARFPPREQFWKTGPRWHRCRTCAVRACRRITCPHGRLCREHTRAALGVCVRTSNIPGAGLGLFATRDFAGGAAIGPYTGEVLTHEQRVQRYGPDGFAPYMMRGGEDWYVDAVGKDAGVMRFVNDGCGGGADRYSDAEVDARCNARVRVHHRQRQLWVTATRDIRAGEEILMYYGVTYWDCWDEMEEDGCPVCCCALWQHRPSRQQLRRLARAPCVKQIHIKMML